MRKVSATVIYKDNTLYNLTVNHKGVLIPLVAYDETSVKHPYEKRTFQTMYKSVLNILKIIRHNKLEWGCAIALQPEGVKN